MKKTNLRKIALWLFIASIISFPLIAVANFCLESFPVLLNLINILLLLVLVGGMPGAAVLLVVSFFVKEIPTLPQGNNNGNNNDEEVRAVRKPEVTYCTKCGTSRIAMETFNGKAYCTYCASEYKNRYMVQNGKLIEKETGAELLNEVVIYKIPLSRCGGDTQVTDFIINIFTDKVEILWGVGWRGGSSHADGANGKEVLEADYFKTHTVDEFLEFLKEQSWSDVFFKEFDIRNHPKILELFYEFYTNSQINEKLDVARIADFYDDGFTEYHFDLVLCDGALKLMETSYHHNARKETVHSEIKVPGELSDTKEIAEFICRNVPEKYQVDVDTLNKNRDLFILLEKKKDIEASAVRSVKLSKYRFECNTIVGPQNPELKAKFNPNINNFEEPIYYSNGIISDSVIHLGSYWLNYWDYEQVTLRRDVARWYVCSVAMWPVHRGASNGGYSETKLDKEFFKSQRIQNREAFLRYFLRGQCAPCITIAQQNPELKKFIDELCGGAEKNNRENGLSEFLGLLFRQHQGGYEDPRDVYGLLYKNKDSHFIVRYESCAGPESFKVLALPAEFIKGLDLTTIENNPALMAFEEAHSEQYSPVNTDFRNKEVCEKLSDYLSVAEPYDSVGSYLEGVAYLAAWERMKHRSLLSPVV